MNGKKKINIIKGHRGFAGFTIKILAYFINTKKTLKLFSKTFQLETVPKWPVKVFLLKQCLAEQKHTCISNVKNEWKAVPFLVVSYMYIMV